MHFALSSALHSDVGEEVAFRLKILADILGAQVRSFSQHDVVNAGVAAVELPHGHEPCVNALDAIQDHDLLYVSDSAKMWRRYTFETALDQERNLSLLAHPHSWLHPAERLCRAHQGRRIARSPAGHRSVRHVRRWPHRVLRSAVSERECDVLRATLHEHEIRRVIGVPGEGTLVVDGLAPLTRCGGSVSLFHPS